MSKLLSKLTNHTASRHYCNYCLHRFSSERLLSEPIPNCEPHGVQKTRIPQAEDEKYMTSKIILTVTRYILQNTVTLNLSVILSSLVNGTLPSVLPQINPITLLQASTM